jgi:hypothetical protein
MVGFEENRIDGTMYRRLIVDTTHNVNDFYKRQVAVRIACSTDKINDIYRPLIVYTTHPANHFFRRRVILIWRPSFALQTHERLIRWQNLISTCAVNTFKPGDIITKYSYLHGC